MSTYCYNKHESISIGNLFANADAFSRNLPNHQYVFNLCENRYHFAVAFLAAAIRRQHILLPSSRHQGALREVISDFDDCYMIYDCNQDKPELYIPSTKIELPAGDNTSGTFPDIPDEYTVCTAFTSGSTGKPVPNPKTWGSLLASTRMALKKFGFDGNRNQGRHIVCTVPAQHMYGLETSIFYPLAGETLSIHTEKPFFPEDIRQALLSAPEHRILITTPIHLKACINSALEWPDIEMIISATAPLDKTLASRAEQIMRTEVREIFGCTETGSIASRRTTKSEIWTTYEGVSLTSDRQGNILVSGPQLTSPVQIPDHLELLDPFSFKLLGRRGDMVNIAGKRASLADLNIKLNSIPGVEDGIFFHQPDAPEGRLSALVVAPGVEKQKIMKQLRDMLDPVFLPRPLLMVSSLSRNDTGKLTRKDLLQCYRQAQICY